MTHISVGNGSDPHVHAFVIGVGSYPYCVNPLGGDGTVRRLLRGVEPLTSAPLSAAAFAQWLLDSTRHSSDPPLGTLEVLISSEHPVSLQTANGPQMIDPATFDSAEAACRRWFDHCNTHSENIAIFFFCGHGWERGGQQQEILMEDLGKDPAALFKSVVNFRRTFLEMRRCQARTQCFFVDSCRNLPADLEKYAESSSRALLGFDLRSNLGLTRDAPIIFSAAPGQKVHAQPNQPTPFTRFLIQTLDGLGAHKNTAGWQLLTDYMVPKFRDVLAWNARNGDLVPAFTPDGEQTGSSVLRTLDGPPEIPFRLGCLPREALSSAHWDLSHSTIRPPKVRPPQPSDWLDRTQAGVHVVRMTFPADSPYISDQFSDNFDTPYFEWDYPVRTV
ncbi:caspase family protein [Kitasatospora sp. NBC_01539]|uniref:caspase family protein n=1 Tax=Kitasatospora sp. NBC_01539 TaxID=2903577 RepID=UPI003860127D